jgi:dethiobiotin synthetase
VREVFVVSGTGTEVGKTWVTSRLLEELIARGVKATARKPVQSFDPTQGPTDADVLALACGVEPEVVCPADRSYPIPIAPPMAAEVLGRPRIAIADLVAETILPEEGIVLVEGVGGPRSPLAHDGDTIYLMKALPANGWILIADAGLGTINATFLSIEAFGSEPRAVFLNKTDEDDRLHALNRDWLVDRLTCPVVTSVDELCEAVHHARSTDMEVR